MVKDFYEILKVKKDASAAEIKTAFRRLARKYHPDVYGGKDSKFKDINEAYDVLCDSNKRARYDRHGVAGPLIIQTKTSKYTIERLYFTGDLADIYRAKNEVGEDVALKIVRDPRNNDLLENEWKILNEVRPKDKKEEKHFRFFPKPIETLKISDGGHRQTNIMTWAEGHHTLQKVRSAFNSELRMEHGVWMFRRLLSALSWVHQGKKIVHGALLPTNILVYSGTGGFYDHGIKLVGWSHAVPVSEKITTIAPQWEPFYPPEVYKKQPVDGSSDIYMAAKCIIYVLGGQINPGLEDWYPSHIPPYLRNFLRGCTLKTKASRPQDAYELLKEFTELMSKNYGPRKYVPFDIPLSA